jgi:hypothetical protein
MRQATLILMAAHEELPETLGHMPSVRSPSDGRLGPGHDCPAYGSGLTRRHRVRRCRSRSG